MYNITLSELIKELQSIEKEYGDREVLSVGSCCGQFRDMRSPFSVRLSNGGNEDVYDATAFIPTRKEDIEKTYVEEYRK